MRSRYTYITLSLALLACGWFCAGCAAEESAEESSNMGVLRLQLSSDDVYITTRAEQALTDWSEYTFQLDGAPITFTDGVAIVPAGTYTLSASNSTAVDGGYAGPLFSGSTTFSLSAGEQKDVTLNLGSPQNAKVTLATSASFTEKYTLQTLTLADGNGSHTITASGQSVYFPATNSITLTYTLVADAKAGSHVQDITNAQGTITIAAGTHTPFTLTINPIDPNLVIIESGNDYNGEFQ